MPIPRWESAREKVSGAWRRRTADFWFCSDGFGFLAGRITRQFEQYAIEANGRLEEPEAILKTQC